MPKTAKIAISLPERLLLGIDRERRASGESRSEFFRRAVQALLKGERERNLEEQYIRGYLEDPETAEEAEGLYGAGLTALAQEPWDDGDNQ